MAFNVPTALEMRKARHQTREASTLVFQEDGPQQVGDIPISEAPVSQRQFADLFCKQAKLQDILKSLIEMQLLKDIPIKN